MINFVMQKCGAQPCKHEQKQQQKNAPNQIYTQDNLLPSAKSRKYLLNFDAEKCFKQNVREFNE